jgi:hypothetical protein
MSGISKETFDRLEWEEVIMVCASNDEVQKYGADLVMKKTVEQCSLGERCENVYLKIVVSKAIPPWVK